MIVRVLPSPPSLLPLITVARHCLLYGHASQELAADLVRPGTCFRCYFSSQHAHVAGRGQLLLQQVMSGHHLVAHGTSVFPHRFLEREGGEEGVGGKGGGGGGRREWEEGEGVGGGGGSGRRGREGRGREEEGEGGRDHYRDKMIVTTYFPFFDKLGKYSKEISWFYRLWIFREHEADLPVRMFHLGKGLVHILQLLVCTLVKTVNISPVKETYTWVHMGTHGNTWKHMSRSSLRRI